ncbi:hypothetical protein Goklo_004713 [Gossypium klotzschianum]|uniref:RNase H type-1 domain-containing protein n=1 Tax=Gossypium klotzschianum TaxID=34286 RepID=A0A7J8VPM7_9ROSI|nr:hypothetical protein [Gossypium klotzschianum]
MDGSKSTSMKWLVAMETGRQLGEFYATRLEIGLKVFKGKPMKCHVKFSRQVLTVKFQFVNRERNKVADWLAKSCSFNNVNLVYIDILTLFGWKITYRR